MTPSVAAVVTLPERVERPQPRHVDQTPERLEERSFGCGQRLPQRKEISARGRASHRNLGQETCESRLVPREKATEQLTAELTPVPNDVCGQAKRIGEERVLVA